MFADDKKTLTIFHDILKATLGQLDDQPVDTIAKQLLLLENISITFNIFPLFQRKKLCASGLRADSLY